MIIQHHKYRKNRLADVFLITE